MKESDWKKFKVIKEKALEEFCTRALNDFQEVISNKDEHAHKRYLSLYQLVQDRDEDLALIFDGNSRSKADIQLMAIRVRGLADESLIAELSDEFQNHTDPKRLSDD